MLQAEKLKNYDPLKFRPGFASVKHNGIHAIYGPKVNLIYSRTPNVIRGMSHITAELSHLAYPVVGELIIPNIDFETCSGRIRDFQDTPEAEFRIFNCFTPGADFAARLEWMRHIRDMYFLGHPKIKFVEYLKVCSVEKFDHFFEAHCVHFNEEGVCWIAPDHVYSPGKRGWKWMKRVPFMSVEATVTGMEAGTKGKKYEHSLGALLCKLDNGTEFKCGIFKGQTDEWRQCQFNTLELVGERITVEFKNYSKYGKPVQPRYKAKRWDLG